MIAEVGLMVTDVWRVKDPLLKCRLAKFAQYRNVCMFIRKCM